MEARSERRHVTVLFCDMVDSARFIRADEEEASRDVERLFTSSCAKVIELFGGRVTQFLGDGILAVFGHPQANEDDAVNAVLAATRMIERIPRLALRPPFAGEVLRARVGIATGLVITDSPGPDGHVPIHGSTTVLAQRLQSMASAGDILVCARTRLIARKRVEFDDLGERTLKGFPRPEPVWQAVKVRDRPIRFPGDEHIAPLIGRTTEIERVLSLWPELEAGHGKVVVISGEPGIGKSRLAQEVLCRLEGRRMALLQFQCEPLYSNTALHPVMEHIRRAAQIASEEHTHVRFDKLASWYGSADDKPMAVALFANLLSLGEDERYPMPALSPRRQRERLGEVLLHYLRDRSREQPVVLLFEDLHWADPTTEEFLRNLVYALSDLRVLLLATARPDYAPAWFGEPHVEIPRLTGLTREDTVALIDAISGSTLDRTTVEQIARLTDGVPIFIEELTKAVTEAGGTVQHNTPPPTLAGLLSARLDQVGPASLVAEIASVIGREFSYLLLARVYRGDRSRLIEGLRRLRRDGLVSRVPHGTRSPADEASGATDAEQDARYVFRHALVQAAAYDRVPRRDRPEVHRRVAEAIERHFAQTGEDEPEVLAHHWTEAGDATKAVAAWLVAGRHASQRCEYVEAIVHIRRGLALLPAIEEDTLRLEQELALKLALGPVLITTQGAGTREVTDLYTRALELCQETPQSPLHFIAHWGWWRTTMDHRAGLKRADKLISLAQTLGKPDLTVQAHHCQWATLYMIGSHEACLQHTEAGLALYDPARDSVHSGLFGGHDAKVCALGESALSLWMLGDYEFADARAEAALDWAAQLSHVGSRVHAMDYALVLQKFKRNYEQVERQAMELASFAKEQRLKVFYAKGNFFCGWARALQGRVNEGLAQMLDGIKSERAADTPHDFALYYEMLAQVQALAGRYAEAQQTVSDAFGIAQGHGIVFWDAELYRREGEIFLALDRTDDAEGRFQQSIACARAQGARSLEQRAVQSSSRLRGGRGPREGVEMHESLETVRGKDADTPALQDAKAIQGSSS